MPDIFIRLIILALLIIFTGLLVWGGRRFVGTRRRRALESIAPASLVALNNTVGDKDKAAIRILAFSSDDCRQCKQLQEPALQHVLEQRSDSVKVISVDAPSSPELTQQYQVLTVPTTVILDSDGKAHSVNYGFANSKRLLEQIDSVLDYIAV